MDVVPAIIEPRVCLNMIVKNESRIICRLLDSVAPLLDAYCICDTGSTDDTVAIIQQYFSRKSIPGTVVTEPFRDFGYNRTFALKSCESFLQERFGIDDFAKNPFYILLLDADMMLQVRPDLLRNPAAFKRGLRADAYHMFQGSDAFYYKNTRIVRAGAGASYWGVTHEYVKMPEGAKYEEIAKVDLFINDIGDGGAKADKYERDIRLLKKGLEECPGNDRYTFYLANSYRNHGDTDLAIETYIQRTKLGGWYEEVWMSMFYAGQCFKEKGDMANAIYWWLNAYQVNPKRLENLYEIVHYYRCEGKNDVAYLFYSMAVKQLVLHHSGCDPSFLFTQRDVYEYKLDYEFSIFGYYCNVDRYDMTRICTKVFNSRLAPASVVDNVFRNYKFYAPKLCHRPNMCVELPAPMATALQTVGRKIVATANGEQSDSLGPYRGTTPALVQYFDWARGCPVVAVCVRFVNYEIDDNGTYINKEKIVTRNAVALFNANNWATISEFEMTHDTSIDNIYVGLEDVRLFRHGGKLMYNANRGLSRGHILVEHGRVQSLNRDADSDEEEVELEPFKEYMHLMMENAAQRKAVEKNWVFFEDARGDKKVIYGWHNLNIGDAIPSLTDPNVAYFKQTHSLPMPRIFEKVRGSTNGVKMMTNIGLAASITEIWFLVHAVSYEDRRYYYHMFVALDAETYALKKYTPFFTFEGEKVEYTLGFIYDNETDALFVGYSTMDRTTKYVGFKREAIEQMFTTNV